MLSDLWGQPSSSSERLGWYSGKTVRIRYQEDELALCWKAGREIWLLNKIRSRRRVEGRNGSSLVRISSGRCTNAEATSGVQHGNSCVLSEMDLEHTSSPNVMDVHTSCDEKKREKINNAMD